MENRETYYENRYAGSITEDKKNYLRENGYILKESEGIEIWVHKDTPTQENSFGTAFFKCATDN